MPFKWSSCSLPRESESAFCSGSVKLRAEGEAFVAALNAGGRARATLIRCHPTAPEADGEAVGGAVLSLMVEVSEGVRLLDEALG